jgi:hypothetical protein
MTVFTTAVMLAPLNSQGKLQKRNQNRWDGWASESDAGDEKAEGNDMVVNPPWPQKP